MLPDDPQATEEKEILRAQYIAVAVAFILFFVSAISSILFFEGDIVKAVRVIFPIVFIPVLFIGISSIKNEVSIMRPKGKRQHSTGKQAVIIGIFLIVIWAINLIVFLTPIFGYLLGALSE